jgi:hypothetical protein
MTRHRIAILPALRRTVLSQPRAPCVERDLQVLACLPDKSLAVKMLRHSCNVVSRADKTSNLYSLALQETVPQQSRRPRAGERSKECSQAPPALDGRVLEPMPQDMAANGRWDTVGNINSCADSSCTSQRVPYPPVAAVPPVQSPQSRHGLNCLMLLSCLILPIRWICCKSQKLSVNVPTQAA